MINERVGFTGSRAGMTLAQKASVVALLRSYAPAWVHHGDCVGADSDFHHAAQAVGAQVMIHPPSDPKLRAKLVGDDLAKEKPYLDRNRDIVNAADVLIATPKETRETKRGGTWYTVRYARQKGKRVSIVWPDGMVQTDGEVTVRPGWVVYRCPECQRWWQVCRESLGQWLCNDCFVPLLIDGEAGG